VPRRGADRRDAAIIPTAVVRCDDEKLPEKDADDFVVDAAMLADALARARKLVSEIERQKVEVEASPPTDLTPEQLAQGKFAFENALASARRMLKALEEASEIAHNSYQPPHEPN